MIRPFRLPALAALAVSSTAFASPEPVVTDAMITCGGHWFRLQGLDLRLARRGDVVSRVSSDVRVVSISATMFVEYLSDAFRQELYSTKVTLNAGVPPVEAESCEALTVFATEVDPVFGPYRYVVRWSPAFISAPEAASRSVPSDAGVR